ncbi:DMT family transporter [Paenibacillus sp.]|uniref:DMT family transporter n=1 Tax=Paenibacillus sp. TaxID=58172 RepID=UPI002D57CB8D|nr:DMT family transporter [Paenibacillus sp.]HZG88542.1 DMT family transporter [Paenibacillus sp.]
MMQGLLWAALAGALVGVQNIFNKKVNERASTWSTTTLVLGLGFAASFALGLLLEGPRLFDLQNMKLWYGFSGLLGVGVVVCVVQATRRIDPTFAVSLMMISQLICAMWWDAAGWMGLTRIPLTPRQLAGVALIAAGVVVFKLAGSAAAQKSGPRPAAPLSMSMRRNQDLSS